MFLCHCCKLIALLSSSHLLLLYVQMSIGPCQWKVTDAGRLYLPLPLPSIATPTLEDAWHTNMSLTSAHTYSAGQMQGYRPDEATSGFEDVKLGRWMDDSRGEGGLGERVQGKTG